MQEINPLYIQALQYAVENQSASITIFQRIFHIGYMGNEPTFKKRQKNNPKHYVLGCFLVHRSILDVCTLPNYQNRRIFLNFQLFLPIYTQFSTLVLMGA